MLVRPRSRGYALAGAAARAYPAEFWDARAGQLVADAAAAAAAAAETAGEAAAEASATRLWEAFADEERAKRKRREKRAHDVAAVLRACDPRAAAVDSDDEDDEDDDEDPEDDGAPRQAFRAIAAALRRLRKRDDETRSKIDAVDAAAATRLESSSKALEAEFRDAVAAAVAGPSSSVAAHAAALALLRKENAGRDASRETLAAAVDAAARDAARLQSGLAEAQAAHAGLGETVARHRADAAATTDAIKEAVRAVAQRAAAARDAARKTRDLAEAAKDDALGCAGGPTTFEMRFLSRRENLATFDYDAEMRRAERAVSRRRTFGDVRLRRRDAPRGARGIPSNVWRRSRSLHDTEMGALGDVRFRRRRPRRSRPRSARRRPRRI